jgi:hypothetical protein
VKELIRGPNFTTSLGKEASRRFFEPAEWVGRAVFPEIKCFHQGIESIYPRLSRVYPRTNAFEPELKAVHLMLGWI